MSASGAWVLLCCVSWSAVTSAALISFGRCPEVSVQNNFQTDLYSGKWYEFGRSFSWWEVGGRCVSTEYLLVANNTLRVRNQMINSLANVGIFSEGTARVTSQGGEGFLEVFLSSRRSPAQYQILSTDYTNYSVVWKCRNLGFLSTRNVWILTRARHPSAEVVEVAYSVLDYNDIGRGSVALTDQSGCAN